MLAQMQTVEPGFLHQFLLVVLGLLGGAAAVVGMYAALRKKKIEPQPFEVAEAQRYSTVESCHAAHSEVARRLDGHDTDIRAIYAELKGDRAQNEIHASQRASALYAKIEDVRKDLDARLSGMSDRVNRGFADQERAIGNVEGMLDAALRNLGLSQRKK